MVAIAVGKRPEDRRQEQLGGEERRREEPQGERVHLRAAVVGQVREVVDEHRAGQARAEPEREGPDHDGPQRAIHPAQGTRRTPGPRGPARRRPGAPVQSAHVDFPRPLVPAPLARGARGAVVAPHHLASAAGLGVLRAGGSAVDAAIATNAVLAVVFGEACGLGGDAFWLIWDEAAGTQVALNGSGRAPAAANPVALRARGITALPHRGPLSITVPGAVRSWGDAHARFGRLPWAGAAGPGDRAGRGRLPRRRALHRGGRGLRGHLRRRAGRGRPGLVGDLPPARATLATRRARSPPGARGDAGAPGCSGR